ncbi:Glycosyltransferase involved in cell wall bisynthesis [Arenibacter nanhaiticus]|uniref:Glycosyltransferase involved in cell wall bisynthesis n=1 Tax=Arenibacter nanhaiticus TaxID=558155 RepID=A0A1M6LYX4_9FLAO|nr:glycosyltransferase family 4 protein [Arenibacter nanhaiticus]SHJ76448.1 Glycosyltransferase involved in cell wall bisynthesis [Arenibacter nanhaiticus]
MGLKLSKQQTSCFNKYKILVSAYACSPNRGSEPGMGWHFVKGLSQFHEVHVIVEQHKWEKPITEYLEAHPELKENLKFYFIEKHRNKRLRKIWPPSYYWFYKGWQKKVYKLALSLDAKENFDLIHQLNMVGYREPGFLWKINKPFVWGPIGGLENSPWAFLPSLGFKGLLFYSGRNFINFWQRNFLSRPKRAAKRPNNALIAATPSNAEIIKKIWHQDAITICEVGQEKNNIEDIVLRNPDKPLKIVWSGIHTPGKNLPLLLKALHKVSLNYELHVLGQGEMTSSWRNTAKNLDIKNISWYGWIEQPKAIDIMKKGHVFVITSISDLTSTVTLEALSYGLPIICLDHCGFTHVVNEQCGIKIPVNTPDKAAVNIGAALTSLYNDENKRTALSKGALQRAADFNWDNKIKALNTIYDTLVVGDKE